MNPVKGRKSPAESVMQMKIVLLPPQLVISSRDDLCKEETKRTQQVLQTPDRYW